MTVELTYLGQCLDPVHIGTGGYQLGHVDMTIVREPATGIPKIPGTSMAGAIRDYAERLGGTVEDEQKRIKTIFGSADSDQGQQALVRFYDAQILLFPVSSQLGTIWVSTRDRLRRLPAPSEDGQRSITIPGGPQNENNVIPINGIVGQTPINLGWLLLMTEQADGDNGVVRKLPDDLPYGDRLVQVSNKLFYHLVNDHLEVRTSVKIDDTTGAAASSMLFTYEAIPRGSILSFEVAVDIDERRDVDSSLQASDIVETVGNAVDSLELLGVGGMTTRGFGRFRVNQVDRREQ